MILFATSGVMVQQTPPTPGTMAPAPRGNSPSAPQGKMEKFRGVVEGVDQTGQSFIVQRHKENMTLYWNDQTKIMHGKKTLSPMDLKKGERVTVAYREEGGKSIADKVTIGKMSHPKTESKT